jgi:Xaa-Pro aminopeptidase
MEKVSRQEIKKRLDDFLSSIAFGKLFIVEDPIDLYYFTGLRLSKGLLIFGNQPILCVDGRYSAVAKQTFPGRVASIDEEKNILKESGKDVICFDSEKTSYARYATIKKYGFACESIDHLTKNLREIKSSFEIALLEKSAWINQQALNHALGCLREGITEEKIAREFMVKALELGAEKMAFDPIIAFGDHTALPHHRASTRSLKQQDPVLIDVGVMFQGYASDMTRTCFFKQGSQELAKLREELIALQKRILGKLRPGISTKELALYAKNGIETIGPYKMIHSLGHGVGLAVHEFPRLSTKLCDEDVLKPGMVITIEPGIYIEGLCGFREEDTILITENGYKNFYKNFDFATFKF